MIRKNVWSFLFFMFALVLSGCVSKETKAFKKDDANIQFIKEAIIRMGEDEYFLPLEPDMSKLSNAAVGKSPLPDDKTLKAPVKVIGTPEYAFHAYIQLDAPTEQTREINAITIDQLDRMGNSLLRDLYLHLYKDAFERLEQLDENLEIRLPTVKAPVSNEYGRYDREELKKLRKSFADDYVAGNFANPDQQSTLLKKHLTELTGETAMPSIIIRVMEPEENLEDNWNDKFDRIVQHIETSDALPVGRYHIHVGNMRHDSESAIGEVYVEEWPDE